MKRFVIVLGCLCSMAVAALVVVKVQENRSTAQDLSCIANLKQIDGATCSWVVLNRKGPNDSPSKSEIFGGTLYIRAEPKCPKGGVYTMGSQSKAPTCAHPGHQITINPAALKTDR